MRVLATLARVVLFVFVAYSGHSCKKADSNSTEPLQQPCSAPEYAFASAFWDGETIWWGDDTSAHTFSGKAHYFFDEYAQIFTLRTPVEVCPDSFLVLKAPHPDLCPYEPYAWHWHGTPEGNELIVQFPESIWSCTMALGQSHQPYSFKFGFYYKP